jgi:hypothetical protein
MTLELVLGIAAATIIYVALWAAIRPTSFVYQGF